jgi:AAA15 family ATPase/GTPase
MNSIRVKNLRCLADTGYIPIKPLTILLGANSTGKSTFLRVFPLLKQSIETPTNTPILWYGEKGYVDFGTIKNALRDSAETISFGFKMLLPASKDSGRYGFILRKFTTPSIPSFINCD